MLPYRSHWHFAFEQNPLREARVLCFAGSPSGPGTPKTPDPDEVQRKLIDELENFS